jgi:hypothetical protein
MMLEKALSVRPPEAGVMTLREIEEILADIACSVGGTVFDISVEEFSGAFCIRLHYMETDIFNGKLEQQNTRRWVVSKHSTPSEIAQTVLKAALTSSEHMVREHFTYKGVRIFNPHIDIEELVKLLRGGSADAPESIAGENTPLPPDGGQTKEGGHNA